MLECEVSILLAFADVEAPHGGFVSDHESSGLVPRVLFERHLFHRATGGRWDTSHPQISNARPGGYRGGIQENRRMDEAAALNRPAALRSASWGRFQILGENYSRAGYSSLQDFVNGMYHSEEEQLRAAVCFLRSDHDLRAAIREPDFETIARLYNGPNYRVNAYDRKLAEAYRRYREVQ